MQLCGNKWYFWINIVFYGESAINLDAKGRLTIPVKYRELLADAWNNKFVLTYNAYENNSLWLYSQEEWERVRDQVMSLSTSVKNNRLMQRRLVGGALMISPDKGSRLLLPINMRKVASLEKKVVMLGMETKFEIWSEEVMDASRNEIPELSDDDIPEDLKNLKL